MNEPVYWEIPSQDVAATGRFLAAVFGWKIEPSTGGYMTVEIEGGIVAGDLLALAGRLEPGPG